MLSVSLCVLVFLAACNYSIKQFAELSIGNLANFRNSWHEFFGQKKRTLEEAIPPVCGLPRAIGCTTYFLLAD